MARQSNPEAFTMSIRVNVRDLAKAGRFLTEFTGNMPTGRSSIAGATLRMMAMMWEERRREMGKEADITVDEAHRWLDERWPRLKGGEAMRLAKEASGMALFHERKVDIEKLSKRIADEKVDLMSEEELAEFEEMMRKEAIKAGDLAEESSGLIKPEGKELLYDPKTFDVYTGRGKKVVGMKWNPETNSTEPDKEMMKKLGSNFNPLQGAEGKRSQEDE